MVSALAGALSADGAAVLKGSKRTPERSVLSGVVDRSRRPEIGADGNARPSVLGDCLKSRRCALHDCRPGRKDGRQDRAERRWASGHRSRRSRRVPPGTQRASTDMRRRRARSHGILRHRHGDRRNGLAQNPDAKGKEQGKRAEADDHAVAHAYQITPTAGWFKASVGA